VSLAEERRAFRNLRNMSAHRLESASGGLGLSGFESRQTHGGLIDLRKNGEGYLNDGYAFQNGVPSKEASLAHLGQ
jgi:hypothetical protein